MITKEYAAALEAIIRVYRALDNGDGAALAACFVAGPEWHRPGGILNTQEAIRRMAVTRDPSRKTAHLVSNLAVETISAGLRCQYQLTVYQSSGESKAALVGLLNCEDVLEVAPDGLLVRSKRSAPLFLFEN